MNPILKNNAFLLIRKNLPLKKISRNMIIIFRSPIQKDLLFIKRVVGLPGDAIQILNTGAILVNSIEMFGNPEKSVPNDSWVQFEWKLKANEFIVLGDNRDKSVDSRNFGPISFDQIIGKVVFNLTTLRILN